SSRSSLLSRRSLRHRERLPVPDRPDPRLAHRRGPGEPEDARPDLCLLPNRPADRVHGCVERRALNERELVLPDRDDQERRARANPHVSLDEARDRLPPDAIELPKPKEGARNRAPLAELDPRHDADRLCGVAHDHATEVTISSETTPRNATDAILTRPAACRRPTPGDAFAGDVLRDCANTAAPKAAVSPSP